MRRDDLWRVEVTDGGRHQAAIAFLRLADEQHVSPLKVVDSLRNPGYGAYEHDPGVPDCAMVYAWELFMPDGVLDRYLREHLTALANGDRVAPPKEEQWL